MKLFPLLTLVVALYATALADSPSAAEITRSSGPGSPAAVAGQPWSVVGTWDCTNLFWSGPLVLQPDGVLIGVDTQTSGRWMLGVQGGQVVLMLYWNGYPTELVSMVTADEFRGSADRNNLRMHRRPSVTAVLPKTAPGNVETRTWSQGEPPVRLIRRDEGFCALTKVTGHFAGDGESVRVHVAEDGYWYLDGVSHQEGVGAECIVVRYRN